VRYLGTRTYELPGVGLGVPQIEGEVQGRFGREVGFKRGKNVVVNPRREDRHTNSNLAVGRTLCLGSRASGRRSANLTGVRGAWRPGSRGSADSPGGPGVGSMTPTDSSDDETREKRGSPTSRPHTRKTKIHAETELTLGRRRLSHLSA